MSNASHSRFLCRRRLTAHPPPSFPPLLSPTTCACHVVNVLLRTLISHDSQRHMGHQINQERLLTLLSPPNIMSEEMALAPAYFLASKPEDGVLSTVRLALQNSRENYTLMRLHFVITTGSHTRSSSWACCPRSYCSTHCHLRTK